MRGPLHRTGKDGVMKDFHAKSSGLPVISVCFTCPNHQISIGFSLECLPTSWVLLREECAFCSCLLKVGNMPILAVMMRPQNRLIAVVKGLETMQFNAMHQFVSSCESAPRGLKTQVLRGKNLTKIDAPPPTGTEPRDVHFGWLGRLRLVGRLRRFKTCSFLNSAAHVHRCLMVFI